MLPHPQRRGLGRRGPAGPPRAPPRAYAMPAQHPLPCPQGRRVCRRCWCPRGTVRSGQAGSAQCVNKRAVPTVRHVGCRGHRPLQERVRQLPDTRGAGTPPPMGGERAEAAPPESSAHPRGPSQAGPSSSRLGSFPIPSAVPSTSRPRPSAHDPGALAPEHRHLESLNPILRLGTDAPHCAPSQAPSFVGFVLASSASWRFGASPPPATAPGAKVGQDPSPLPASPWGLAAARVGPRPLGPHALGLGRPCSFRPCCPARPPNPTGG